MIIKTEETPNPNAIKFLLDRDILGNHKNMNFSSRYSASISPLALNLFDLEGVSTIYIGKKFIVVTKSEQHTWKSLKTDVLSIITKHLLTHQPIVVDCQDFSLCSGMPIASGDEEIVNKIKALLDQHVRPALASDGGDVAFFGYRNGSVYLKMQGSCQGCPSSSLTLKHGVERILRQYIPEIISVEKVEI